MSTIPGGTFPTPVSGVSGSSKKRGSAATSSVVPPGTSVLLPASTAGEPDPRRRSEGGERNRGSAAMSPAPGKGEPPWTSQYVIVPADEGSKKISGTRSFQKTLFEIVFPVLSRNAAP